MQDEGKFLKRAWASRDEQRLRRHSYRKLIKREVRRLLVTVS